MEGTPRPRVHFFVLMIASIGNAVVWGMSGFIQFHATKPAIQGGFGLGGLEIGLIFGISAVFTSISNILWGAASDRTNTRWGKRKPFMFLFPLLVTLTLWISASVDVLFGVQAIFWALLISWTMKSILHAGANVPYTTVIPEVVPPEKRVAISQLGAFVQGIGFALGAVVPTFLFQVSSAFSMPFAIAGAFMVMTYLASSTAIPASSKPVSTVSALQAMRSTLRDRNFMRFEIAQFLWTLGLNIVIFVLPFIAQDVLGIVSESIYGWFFLSFLGIAGVLLFGINYVLQKRHVEKKKALLFSLVLSAIALVFIGFIGTPAFGSIPILVQVYTIGSFIFAGLVGIFIFPYAIMMGLIDYDSGSEATYNGTNSTVLGFAAIPAGPIGGLLVLNGYPWVGIICALLFIVSIAVMLKVNVPEHLFHKKEA